MIKESNEPGPHGGPAFPLHHHAWGGMSLRDYFAGQALCGIAGPAGDGFSLSPADSAEWAYQYADAMLAARDAQ